MSPKLRNQNNVVAESKDAVTTCVVGHVPYELAHRLEGFYPPARKSVKEMLRDRTKCSTKFFPELPSVLAKALIAKYQRNRRCKNVRSLVLPLCGDKGKCVKWTGTGFRIPALWKKKECPVVLRHPIVGHVRSVEFYRRNGEWFFSLCYRTPKTPTVSVQGTVGIDRNSVGNIAVLADPQTGTVRHLGWNADGAKRSFRNRRKNLQKERKYQLLSTLRRKQSRRSAYQNHCVSKQIVDYAVSHCCAIALEALKGISSAGSKAKRYCQRSQWAFAQLDSFVRYKAALSGIPVVDVDPAYTSQTCSRCGSITKPDGKRFSCTSCGHNDHRDANAAFVIAYRGWQELIGGSMDTLSAVSMRHSGVPLLLHHG